MWGWGAIVAGLVAGRVLVGAADAGFRLQALPAVAAGQTGFVPIAAERSGVMFTNALSDEAAARNQVLLSGSGVACGDVDGDGWCDLYLCGLEGPNALYRNLGDWRFTNVTVAAGVACDGQYSTGAALVDVDGDGDLDLLVNGVGVGTRLFLNEGAGRFREATDAGLVRRYAGMGLGLGDVDGDGDLDLYVANYRTDTVRSTGFDLLVSGNQRMVRPQDRDRLYVSPEGFIREYGEPDACYLNDGRGRFALRSWTDGTFLDAAGRPLTEVPRDWSYSVLVRDLNEDGAPDLYVTGDFWSPDRCWLNDGKGRFRAMAREALPCTSSFSMGLDAADLNRDGHDDLLVLDMLSPDHTRRLVQTVLFGLAPQPIGFNLIRPEVGRNTLFLSRGDGTYAEIAQLAGLAATDWSWCPVFLDVDLDGYEDLLVPTGHGFDTQDADAEQRIRSQGPWPRERTPYKLWEYPPLRLPNRAYRNRGDLTFEEVGRAWGFDQVGISQGIALADLDNDGDLDVVLNNMNAAASLLRNTGDAPRLAVRLRGTAPNTQGIGAVIRVTGGPVVQSQQMVAGGRFCSSDDAVRVFAAGHSTNRLTVEVVWRGGRRSVIEGVPANRLCVVEESGAVSESRGAPTAVADGFAAGPWFEDVSSALAHAHHEEPFDELARQPLMPRRLSQLGPGVAWIDLDGDRREELVIGSGRGGRLAVFHRAEDGAWVAATNPVFAGVLGRDLSGLVGWHDAEGRPALLAGSANYEDGLADGAMVRRFAWGGAAPDDQFAGAQPSVGPLALADYDGDGDLDLLVGGRVLPGRYPEPATSFLFRNEGGRFVVDRDNSAALARVGLVSGAVWTELTGEGLPELVLACEWGPLRVFRNERGTLREATRGLGLDAYVGWWNGVTAGDFDGDGRMDLAASNWGRNTQYEPFRSRPIRLYYGDFQGGGGVDLVEAYTPRGEGRERPWRSLGSVAVSMPFLLERFAAHRAYAGATLAEVLGPRLAGAAVVEATWLESTVFLNRGERMEARVLPWEAQVSPAFGVTVGDADGDGREDLFLSQNFFGVHPEDSPLGSGRGLWLRGDGRGGFRAVPAPESGVSIPGEQRGCALADFDTDGRVDLAVGQNGGATKLYRNRGGAAGLRVSLQGPPGNPSAVGAILRWFAGEAGGPARELHAGSGYWSQDGVVTVLGCGGREPTALEVRWPGGVVTRTALTPRVRSVRVDLAGRLLSSE